MLKLKKILCPTDFSDNAKVAQRYACSLASQFSAELHFIHVVADPSTSIPPFGWGYIPKSYLTDMRGSSDTELGKITCADKNIAIVRKTIEGVPAPDIVRYAEKQGISLIVICTHGRSPVRDMILGSVAERVVRKSGCPVLTVHPDDQRFVEEG